VIVVDTSVWIDLLNGNQTPQTHYLKRSMHFQEEDFVLTDVVLTEILQGLRTEKEVVKVERYLADFDVLRLQDLADFRAAAALYRAAREQGITIRSTTDCLIAAICVREACPLLHADKDFSRLAGATSLTVVDVE
jgi:predicted nucleic acid-binding protein